jgi:hypothetical protein
MSALRPGFAPWNTLGAKRCFGAPLVGAVDSIYTPPELPTIQPLSAYWEPETETYETAIGGFTDAEKYAVDRLIKTLKLWDVWDDLLGANSRIFLTCQSTKAKGLVNLLDPTKVATEVGTTTFAAFDGISTSGVANYLDTGIAVNVLSRNSICFGGICVSANAGVAASYDMGVVDASSTTRCLLLSRNATDTMSGAAMCPTVATLGASTDFAVTGQLGPVWMNRVQQADFGVGRWTQRRVTSATVSVAPVGTTPFKFLWATGATASAQKWGAFWLVPGLTDEKAGYLAAALQFCVDGYRNGLPNVQPAGYGDAAPSVDVLFNDNNIDAAYECKRTFPALNVGILCDYVVESVEQLGLQNCINWADVTTGLATPAASGQWRESRRQENLRQGTADANSRTGNSTASQSKNLLARRKTDPTRSTGALPGLDLPIWFSTGFRSMNKVGISGNTLTTNDGRVITFKYIGEGGYDGDVLYHLGVPVVMGREAGGSNKENLNGYRPTQRSKPRDFAGNSYAISPWVEGGTGPTGTKLPFMIDMPSLTTGQACAAMQSMNIRQQVVDATNNKGRKAPWTGGVIYAQPARYDVGRYEGPGRVNAAITAAGRTQTKNDFMSFSPDAVENICQGPYGNVLDINNGPSISTDLGNNGNLYAAAGQSIAARKQVIQDLIDYFLGYPYWIISSGDSRIASAIVTSMSSNFGLDATAFLDHHSMFPLHVSKFPYRRNTVYRLASGVGGAVLDANDCVAADGGAPRISSNIITLIQYSFDNHAEFWAPFDAGDGDGTVFHRFGSFSDASQGNTNFRTPVPAEVCMAAEADAPMMMTWTGIAATYPTIAAYRMEYHQGLAAQMCGIILGQACTDGVSVQNTVANKMGTIRTLAAAAGAPDSVAPTLTQTT